MSRRTDKIARCIQVNLAELINYHLNDPRIVGIITVSEVTISPDLTHARVRVTALNADDARMRTLVRALQSAAGKLRALLADRVEMRTVPQLSFDVDVHAIKTRETLEAIARAMQNTRPLPTEEGVGEGESGRGGDEEDNAGAPGRGDAETDAGDHTT
ncbi:MAG: 30S ribosome-binding factor RbfA [Phycisphaerae bacterium]|nr:30S ribosome-binding factor RbfA [Phycisphaerae bacterium]